MQNGESKCYGFANFPTHEDALAAKKACERGDIKVRDSKVLWRVRADWAKSNGKTRAGGKSLNNDTRY